ncbi:hypothetical protein [Crossiella sp. CA198]|uniref:hypothetical protein n=1 Tax=Crossiella sp. CA198 TaxID=3455607 RepID=UPI003F8CFAC5
MTLPIPRSCPFAEPPGYARLRAGAAPLERRRPFLDTDPPEHGDPAELPCKPEAMVFGLASPPVRW